MITTLRTWHRAVPVVLLVIVCYGPALDAGFLGFDDQRYVVGNDNLGTPEGLWRIWTEVGGEEYRHQYYPLTSTAFWLQHAVWGLDPFGYHLVNVLLHAANAVLLGVLLAHLRVPGAWVAAAVFAVHPVHVPSVAWVAELKNVLSGCFFLASMLALTAWMDPGGERRSGRGVYWLGLGLFGCALLSKSATCILPVALLLVAWWKRGRVTRRDLQAVVPAAVLGAAFVGLTVFLEMAYGGASGDAYAASAAQRVLVAGRSLWFYGWKLAWPAGLVFIYPRWTVDAWSWWQWLYPLAASGVLVALWALRGRIGRGPAAAAAYFAVALAPLSLVNVAYTRFSWVADHWTYWASMGAIAAVVGAAWTLSRRPAARPYLVGGTLAAVGVLAVLTFTRARVFESPRTLWTHTLARNPHAYAAHNNLGTTLARQLRVEEAMEHYRRALELQPDYELAWYNLAHSEATLGDHAAAARHYREAVRRAAEWPDARYNLANELAAIGDIEAAIEQYREAVRLEPRFARAHYNLANTLAALGRTGEAIAHYRAAIAADPGHADAHNNLGVELLELGRYDDAAHEFAAALRIEPAHGGAAANLRLTAARRAAAAAAGGREP